jgi:hypothetical protein
MERCRNATVRVEFKAIAQISRLVSKHILVQESVALFIAQGRHGEREVKVLGCYKHRSLIF